MTQKLQAVLRLLRTRGPEGQVSKRWLFRSGSRLDRKFKHTAPLTFTEKEGFVEISINDQLFLWPSGAPKAGIKQILSEILTPIHPHQYIYGPTQIDRNDVVLDIGACEGAFSAFVTGRCKSVIAIEPSRSMCSLMAELFKRRGQPCPTILNCLVGSEKTIAYFHEDRLNPGASRVTANPIQDAYQVPVTTLDDALLELAAKPSL